MRWNKNLPGLIRNFLDTITNEDMNVLRTILDKLALNIALTIINALSNHVSRCGRVIYPSTKASNPAKAPIINAYN